MMRQAAFLVARELAESYFPPKDLASVAAWPAGVRVLDVIEARPEFVEAGPELIALVGPEDPALPQPELHPVPPAPDFVVLIGGDDPELPADGSFVLPTFRMAGGRLPVFCRFEVLR